LPRVHRSTDSWLLFEAFPGKAKGEADLGLKERLPLLLEFALLKRVVADTGERATLVVLTHGKTSPWLDVLRDCDWTDAQWSARVAAMVAFYWRGLHGGAQYFPKTSGELVRDANDLAAARSAWRGQAGSRGERDYAPGYARLLGRGLALDDLASTDWLRLQAGAAELRALLHFDGIAGADA
ncbi:MAG TPA: hypothetical protein VFY12_03795, partial [Arenimonas sp.]|nr:hypothetical protein [Arenimonas sp.]